MYLKISPYFTIGAIVQYMYIAIVSAQCPIYWDQCLVEMVFSYLKYLIAH